VTAAAPGPLAEEAARLFEAIGDWARGATGASNEATADTASATSKTRASSGPECQVCPLCQLLAVVRRMQPDTFAHLADASAAFVAAMRTVVDRHDHGSEGASGVERIDLDDHDTGVAT
jgi:hypothetical protein